jgi:hypothetical protein
LSRRKLTKVEQNIQMADRPSEAFRVKAAKS